MKVEWCENRKNLKSGSQAVGSSKQTGTVSIDVELVAVLFAVFLRCITGPEVECSDKGAGVIKPDQERDLGTGNVRIG